MKSGEKRYAQLSSCENVIGALHKCKWQDSCGSLCVILISLSLPDLSHIPWNIFKARNKKEASVRDGILR